MSPSEVLLQQLITGLCNGMIIALIALGYTMVYGIIELINFAHGDLFMLGAFLALTLLGLAGIDSSSLGGASFHPFILVLLVVIPIFCAALNFLIDRYAYRPLRNAPRLAPLVSAIGISFVLLNVGLFWGGLPLQVFNMGRSAASPKDFPSLAAYQNLLGDSNIMLTARDLLVFFVTVPLLLALRYLVKHTTLGKAMRAVAQNPMAAGLMGIDANRIISFTFVIGGALAGAASVIYALYNNTVFFQMGYRVGIDAFTAAVLGGIGNLTGAALGGIVIGLLRAASDQYLASQWTNVVVFTALILVLVFRPAGLLGARVRDKV